MKTGIKNPYTLYIGNMEILVVLFGSVLVYVNAFPEVNHLTQRDHQGRDIDMDLIHDSEDKTVMAIIGDVSMYENGDQTVNFHDYSTGYGVLKNINSRLCMLTKTPIKMQPEEKYRVGFTTEVHDHMLKNFSLVSSTDDVRDIAGPKIAAFCKDYTTVLAAVSKDKIRRRSVPTERRRRAWCFISKCGYDPQQLQRVLQRETTELEREEQVRTELIARRELD